MPNFVYTTSRTEYGPFLIAKESLAKLDEILEENWNFIERATEEELKEAIEIEVKEQREWRAQQRLTADENEIRAKAEASARKSYRFSGNERKVMFRFRDAKLSDTTFSNAIKHPEAQKEAIQEIDVSLERGKFDCSLNIDEHSLTLRVSPENTSESRELFYALSNWVDEIKPSPFVRVWRDFGPWLPWLTWGFLLVVLLGVLSSQSKTYSYKQEARQMLSKGIQPGEERKALELLLAISSEYQGPQPTAGDLPFWMKVFFFGGIGACLILSFPPPKIIIGIGGGERRLLKWNKWLKFVTTTIPFYVVGNIVLPILKSHFLP
jgi:hypothetical protein